MTDAFSIRLAQEKAFRLGALTVRPSLREVVHDDGRRETVEPKVMQVLVALGRVAGQTLTRDDLIQSCWEGRVVGDDAMYRIISRLHRVADGIGRGAFRVENIARVGYRLVIEGGEEQTKQAAPTRRLWLVGGAVLGVAAASGAGWLMVRKLMDRGLDPATARLYDQGWIALGNATPEQRAQAIGLFRRVTETAPDHADGWGALAYAYATTGKSGDPSARGAMRLRAAAAAQRAWRLEPSNALAAAATTELQPVFGNWLAAERALRAASRRAPTVTPLTEALGDLLGSVGRLGEAAECADRIDGAGPATPRQVFRHAMWLWGAGRLEEAQRLLERTLDIYPRHTLVWFTYFLLLARSGRPEKALALAADQAARPLGVIEQDFDVITSAAEALRTRAPADIERAMKANLDAARRGPGYAENAAHLASMLGRQDEAFAVLEAYYFSPEPLQNQPSFSGQQGVFYGERRTQFLFMPSLSALRDDPRFERLVQRLGLTAYWKASGHPPDYQARR